MRDKLGRFIKGHKINLGKLCSLETKIKISQSEKGKIVSEEIRKKLSIAGKGRISSMKGKKHTFETKEKLSYANFKRYKQGEKFGFQKGNKLFKLKKNFKHSPETLNRLSKTWFKKGIQNNPSTCFKKGHKLNIGRKVSEELREKMSLMRTGKTNYQLGKKRSEESRKKMSLSRKGKYAREKCPNWKGGITPLHFLLRNSMEFKQWRSNIFERDNYTCQECFNKGGKLHSHHKDKSFSQLFQEFLQQYSQFSPIEDKETLVRLAMTYEPFWDIDNGETLCKGCHSKTKTYRKKFGNIGPAPIRDVVGGIEYLA